MSRQWLEDPVMRKIKHAAMRRGNNGIREFTQSFRNMDRNGNDKLCAVELREGLAGWGVSMTERELNYIMVAFDKDGDKQLSLKEFLEGLRIAMNPRRKNVVKKAFLALDRDGSGFIDIHELRARFMSSTNPAVLSGEKTEDQVTQDFLENFDDATNPDGLISQEEFEAYYAGVSQNVENDDYFEMMVSESFGLEDPARPRFAPGGPPEHDAHGFPTHPDLPVTAEEVFARPERALNDRDYNTTHMQGGRAPDPDVTNKYLPHTWETTQRADFGFYEKSLRELAAPARPVGEPDLAQAPTGNPVIDRIRAKILKRAGKRGFRGIARVLRIMDDNGNKKLSREELKEGLQVYQVPVTMQELQMVFQFFDRNGDGNVSVTEFLRGVRGPMVNARRMELVKMAFARLDKDGSGHVPFNELAASYDVYKHPAVMSKEMTPEQVMQEFIEDWDRNCDGTVTLTEFIDYYGDLSAGIDSDVYFELMIRNAWHISGGTGVAANTTCRRVLVTFMSGKQEVKEIKDDLGIRADDIPRMLRALNKQGVTDIKHIELHH